MVITIAIACVTTSIAVSIATTKILAACYFKIVDSYVDEMCKETRKVHQRSLRRNKRATEYRKCNDQHPGIRKSRQGCM